MEDLRKNAPHARCAINREEALTNVYSDVEWSEVLSFEIAKSGGTPMKLSDYIAQKDYYHTALTKFKGQADSKADRRQSLPCNKF